MDLKGVAAYNTEVIAVYLKTQPETYSRGLVLN